jgi:hypothetical protein
MTTDEIIDELNRLTIVGSEDYTRLDRLDALTALLAQNPDGYRACEAMLSVLERHPRVDFGLPGQLVHAIESYRGYYESLLLNSLDRQPTATTIWLLNRIVNAATGAEKSSLVARLHRLQMHPHADARARAEAEAFYHFQTK